MGELKFSVGVLILQPLKQLGCILFATHIRSAVLVCYLK